jgi:hypothetical protein|tara:strand:- start:12 stop:125 length:114 start_codon:yes stop_codon:yes gene_type:complete
MEQNPFYVYAVTDETVVDRIYELSDELVRFTTSLNSS